VIATARVLGSQRSSGGTAFAVSRLLALTAFHVVGDRKTGKLFEEHVNLQFDGFMVQADVCGQDSEADVAVLRLQENLPPDLEPAALTMRAEPGESWSSPAFPVALAGPVSLRGTITAVEGRLPGTDVPAIQLQCDQSAAGNPLSLTGASGGAILLDGSSAAGIIRWNPTHPDRPGEAVGGILYACPVAAAVRCCPELLTPLLVPRARRVQRLGSLVFQTLDNGRLPLVQEIEPHDVGATPTRYSEQGLAPYVPRKADEKIRRIVRHGRFVLVVGPAKAGKSRSAFEALRDPRSGLREAAFLQPRMLAESLAGLIDLDAQEPLGDGELVIWLDDFDEYLRAGGNLDPALWNRLQLRSPRAVLVATITQQRLDVLLAEGGDSARFLRQVIPGARVDLRQELDPSDLPEARRLYPYEDFSAGIVRIAARLTRGDEIVGQLRRADEEHPYGFAVVMAAIDWRRVGLTAGIPRKLLRELYKLEMAERFPDLAPSDENFEEGLAWALAMSIAPVSLFVRQPGRRKTYKVLDYAEQVVRDEEWPLPEALWDFAIRTLAEDQVWHVGVAADAEYRPDIAQLAYQELLRRGDPSGAVGIGRQLVAAGQIDDARIWFEQAVNAGLVSVMLEVGVLLAAHDPEECSQWLLRALNAGFPEAANNLGVLAWTIHQNFDDARYWFETAATAGLSMSRAALAALLVEAGRADEAKPLLDELRTEPVADETEGIAAVLADSGEAQEAEWWWRRCVATGSRTAVIGLAKFLSDHDRPEEAIELLAPLASADDLEVVNSYAVSLWRAGQLADAERQFLRLAVGNDPMVLQNIAELLVEQGRVAESEAWYQRAADAGNDFAIACLAELAQRRGDTERELSLLREAAARDLPVGHRKLGLLLLRQGQEEEAVGHLSSAAEADDAGAANDLGLLCADRGASIEAYYWYQLADDLGSTAVPLWNLGKLLWSEGRLNLAAQAFEGAAERGAEDVERIIESLDYEDEEYLRRVATLRVSAEEDPQAAYELGVALIPGGELREARTWLARAAQAGIAAASLRLGDLAADVVNESALKHYEAAALAGVTLGMVRLGRLLMLKGDTAGAQQWLERAYREGTLAAAAYLARVHDAAGDRQSADEWLARAQEASDPDCLLGRAELAEERGDASAPELFIAAANAGALQALPPFVGAFSRAEPERAARWLSIPSSSSPQVAWVYAIVLARLGFLDEAREAADFAAEAGAPAAKRQLIQFLGGRGDWALAEEVARELVRQTGEPIDEFNLAVVYSERDELEKALLHCRTAVSGGMLSAQAHLAQMLIRAGESAQALLVLEAPVQRGDSNALAARGTLAELSGDLAEAERWYRQALPESVPAAHRLAKICIDRNDYEGTVSALLPSAEDGDSKSASTLGILYEEKIGDIDRAEHWYREAAVRASAIGAYKVAQFHTKRGEAEIAERWLRRAVEDGSGIAAHDIAELMLRRGLTSVAEVWYKKAFDLGHDNAAFDVGVIMAARGKYEQAQSWYAKAMRKSVAGTLTDDLPADWQIFVVVTRENWDGTGGKQYIASIGERGDSTPWADPYHQG
jgi:hypothetical protein